MNVAPEEVRAKIHPVNLIHFIFSNLFSMWIPDVLNFKMSYQTPSNSFYIMKYLYFYITETLFFNLTPKLQTRFPR